MHITDFFLDQHIQQLHVTGSILIHPGTGPWKSRIGVEIPSGIQWPSLTPTSSPANSRSRFHSQRRLAPAEMVAGRGLL